MIRLPKRPTAGTTQTKKLENLKERMTDQEIADAVGVCISSVWGWSRGTQRISRYNQYILDLVDKGVNTASLTFTPKQWKAYKSCTKDAEIRKATKLSNSTIRSLNACATEIPRIYQIILASSLGSDYANTKEYS